MFPSNKVDKTHAHVYFETRKQAKMATYKMQTREMEGR